MLLRQKYLQILSGMVPIGAAGIALLLGSSAPVAADQGPAGPSVRTADAVTVSARLAAIRDAVSDAAEAGVKATDAGTGERLAWVAWRNGGGGGAWRNGGARWGNGGARWGNGGARWGNGGWHNGWHNYWRNY